MEGAGTLWPESATFVLNREKRVHFSGQQTRRLRELPAGSRLTRGITARPPRHALGVT